MSWDRHYAIFDKKKTLLGGWDLFIAALLWHHTIIYGHFHVLCMFIKHVLKKKKLWESPLPLLHLLRFLTMVLTLE